MKFTRQIIYLAKKDCIEELKDLFKALVPPTKEENGCLMFDVYNTKSNLVEFIVMESWENVEILTAHYQTEHYLEFKENLNKYCVHVEPFELDIV